METEPKAEGAGEEDQETKTEEKETEVREEDTEQGAKAETLEDASADSLLKDVGEFEVTAERLDQVMKNMEMLLTDVEQLRDQCTYQAKELMEAAADLRQQQEDLKSSYTEMSQDMEAIMDSIEELLSTKSAFEAKEKEMQKLSRQF